MKEIHDITATEGEISESIGNIRALAYHHQLAALEAEPLVGQPPVAAPYGCSPAEVSAAVFAAIRMFSDAAFESTERLAETTGALKRRLKADNASETDAA